LIDPVKIRKNKREFLKYQGFPLTLYPYKEVETMRALHPMTMEERDFAEQQHDLVIEFLHCKRLPMDDFYDVVIFGYLSAVEQYFRDPPVGVCFKIMAFRAMKDALLREREHNAHIKRSGVTVRLDDISSTLADTRQDTQRQIESKVILEQAVSTATPRQAKIIHLLADGFALHEAARFLKMPKSAVVNCMENFFCQAKATFG